MSTPKTPSIFPPKFQVLSGSDLKLLAIIIMLIDHIGSIILINYPPALVTWFKIGSTYVSAYRLCRDIGRSAFPIFCFLLVEGFIHTRNRFRYGCNLLLFALISEIPWNFRQGGQWLYPEKQNVFFTLFLGYLGFCAAEYFWENRVLQFLCLGVLLAASYYLHADYGWKGYIFLLIMYFLRNERASQAIVGSCWLHYEWKACFAFIPINMYNGERGFVKGKYTKYLFYAFYPVHITVLTIIRNIWFS